MMLTRSGPGGKRPLGVDGRHPHAQRCTVPSPVQTFFPKDIYWLCEVPSTNSCRESSLEPHRANSELPAGRYPHRIKTISAVTEVFP